MKEKIFRYSSEKNIGGQIKRIAQNFMWFDTVVLFIGGIVMFFAGIIYSEDLWGLCIGSLFTALRLRSWHMWTNLPIYALVFLWKTVLSAGKILWESAGTVGASEVIFGANSGNKKQSLWTKMKESSDTDRKKAELDRLKEQGLITEEEYRKKANSDSVSTKPEK